MKKQVDLYNSHYGKVEAEVYRAVRVETYGEDLGQTSWITAAECDEFCRWLGFGPDERVLEVACGSGRVAVRMAERLSASVVGVDINESAVLAATTRARAHAVHDRVDFRVADANEALPFPEESFDVLFCNDSINHLRDRQAVLADWYRILRPRGRFLYTDPIVVTGCLSNAEIETRSSIGFFLFTPLRSTGFRLVLVADVTEGVSRISRRWHDARAKRREALCELEGGEKFEELQRFLATVHTLASERRLSRFAFMGEKPERVV